MRSVRRRGCSSAEAPRFPLPLFATGSNETRALRAAERAACSASPRSLQHGDLRLRGTAGAPRGWAPPAAPAPRSARAAPGQVNRRRRPKPPRAAPEREERLPARRAPRGAVPALPSARPAPRFAQLPFVG